GHDFLERRQRQTNTVCGNHGTGEQRCPIVGALPALATNQGNRNPDECSCRCERIAAVMPGVGLHRGALEVSADAIYVPEQKFLDHNYPHKNAEREWRRPVMRRQNFTDIFDREANRPCEHADRDNQSCNGLSLAVAVWVRSVWRSCRYGQSAPNDNRAADIERRFDSISDQD